MGDLEFLEFIFPIQSNLYIWGTQAYFYPKNEEFCSNICHETKFRLDYNPREMKNIFVISQLYILLCLFTLYSH